VGYRHFRSRLPRFRPFRKPRVFWAGLRYAIKNDVSVGLQVLLSGLTVGVCVVFHQWLDVLVILVATGLMLAAELLTTAIEELCDFVEPDQDVRIGAIKDVSSAAVGFGVLVWALTLLLELGQLLQGRQ
jgi:diacylglycerol kinase (ATP)